MPNSCTLCGTLKYRGPTSFGLSSRNHSLLLDCSRVLSSSASNCSSETARLKEVFFIEYRYTCAAYCGRACRCHSFGVRLRVDWLKIVARRLLCRLFRACRLKERKQARWPILPEPASSIYVYIYFDCRQCESWYVCRTLQHLNARFKQHVIVICCYQRWEAPGRGEYLLTNRCMTSIVTMKAFSGTFPWGNTLFSLSTASWVLVRCAGTWRSSWFKIGSLKIDILASGPSKAATTGLSGLLALWIFCSP